MIRGEGDSEVMTTDEALRLAEEQGLDLVEVGPNQSPPVVRVLDYGRFKYIQAKKEKEARRASKGATQQREVRMSPVISDNDVQQRIRVVRKLLDEGAKVRVAVVFRGRQQTHPEIAMRVLRNVAEGVKDVAKLERAPTMESRALAIVLAPAQTPGSAKEKSREQQPAATAAGPDEERDEASA